MGSTSTNGINQMDLVYYDTRHNIMVVVKTQQARRNRKAAQRQVKSKLIELRYYDPSITDDELFARIIEVDKVIEV